MTLTPAVVSDKDTVRMPSMTLAGKNAWMGEVRRSGRRPDLYRAGKGEPFSYSHTVDFEKWMSNSEIVMIADTLNECKCEPAAGTPVPIAEIRRHEVPEPASFNYQPPKESGAKIFDLSGRANIIFRVNRTDINWDYANNYAELDSILASIRAVRENPDATVESITLTGYASPEGSYANNVRLARGRTEEVLRYVRLHSDFPSGVFHTNSVPEDWAGLKKWLEENPSFHNSAEIIAFIDRDTPIEQRNDQLRKLFPEEYKYLLANVYPQLRHTDYVIRYRVRKYETVAELRKVYAERPYNLSESEFYKLANSYGPGTPEYDEVLMMCAHVYPTNSVANLNAANAAMQRGQYVAAQSYLRMVADGPEKDYAQGMLYTLRGEYKLALPLLEKARKAGVKGAGESLERLERLMHPEPDVKIL